MLAKIVRECYGKEISECRKEELYHALLTLVQKKAGEKEENTGKKKLYYISAEFLIGKRAGAITWQRWFRKTGSLLFRFHCDAFSAG